MDHILPLIFCALFLMLIYGWGVIALRPIPGNQALIFGSTATIGCCVVIFVGGIFNASYVVSPLSNFIVWLLGVAGAGLYLKRHFQQTKFPVFVFHARPLFVLLVLLLVFVGLRIYTSAVHDFNWHDDAHAYLVMPIKMLDTGSLGPEPFNFRKMTTFGGMAYLHSLALSVIPLYMLNLLDEGAGWLLLMGLVWQHKNLLGMPVWAGLSVLLLMQFVSPQFKNISGEMLPAALLYFLFVNYKYALFSSRTNTLLMSAFVGATLISIKHTYIPVVCSMLMLYVLASLSKGKQHFIKLSAGAFVVVVVILLPWMLISHTSNETYFYPTLGKGTAEVGKPGGGYGLALLAAMALDNLVQLFSKLLPWISVFLLIVLIVFRPLGSNKREIQLFCFVWLGVIATNVILSANVSRYIFPIVLPFTLFLLVEAISAYTSPTQRRNVIGKLRLIYVLVPITVLALIAFNLGATLRMYQEHVWFIVRMAPKLKYDHVSRGWAAELQQVIPRGSTILARYDAPFNFDFARNTIYTTDWPCMSSPGARLDCAGSAEKFAKTLRDMSIDYVIYANTNEANFSSELYAKRLRSLVRRRESDGLSPFEEQHVLMYEKGLKFNELVSELSQRYHVVKKTRRGVVIDVNQPTRS